MIENNTLKNSFEDIIRNLVPKLSSYEYICNVSSAGNAKIHDINTSLSDGLASLCVLFSELNKIYPNKNYDKIAHKFLTLITKTLNENNYISLSLWGGICGIALSSACMSDGFSRYRNFLNSVNKSIIYLLNEKLKFLKSVSTLKEKYYDVMYGLAGIANYCMLFLDSKEMIVSFKLIVEYFISLCKDYSIDGMYYPGFTINAVGSPFIQNKKSKYYVNLGLSHGIPGVLLILVKSYMKGIRLSGHLKAIQYLKDILLNSYIINQKRWPDSIIFHNGSNKGILEKCYMRDAWCYGTPGVAYVMLKTAEALNDGHLKTISVNAMLNSLKHQRGAIPPTFCHGYAGLLYLSNRFYKDTKIESFNDYQKSLVRKIFSSYNRQYAFGFKNIDIVEGKKCQTDNFGLLSGTIGIMLSLLAVYYGRKTPWDVAFLLDEY